MKSYVVWNPEKLRSYHNTSLDYKTLDALIEYEKQGNGSLHSYITCSEKQLGEFLTAVHNETDVVLCVVESTPPLIKE